MERGNLQVGAELAGEEFGAGHGGAVSKDELHFVAVAGLDAGPLRQRHQDDRARGGVGHGNPASASTPSVSASTASTAAAQQAHKRVGHLLGGGQRRVDKRTQQVLQIGDVALGVGQRHVAHPSARFGEAALLLGGGFRGGDGVVDTPRQRFVGAPEAQQFEAEAPALGKVGDGGKFALKQADLVERHSGGQAARVGLLAGELRRAEVGGVRLRPLAFQGGVEGGEGGRGLVETGEHADVGVRQGLQNLAKCHAMHAKRTAQPL